MLRTLIFWGICATLVALPWYVIRFSIAGVPLTLLEVFALLTILLWVANAFLQVRINGFGAYCKDVISKLLRWWKIALPIVLFVIAASISVLVSENTTASLGIYKAYIIEPLLMMGVIFTIVDSTKKMSILVGALLFSVVQVSLIGISQAWLGWPNITPAELIQGRSSALYNSANAVGLFIGPLVLLAGSIALGWHKGWMIRVAYGLVGLLGLIAIYYSRSDGAMIAIVSTGVLAGILMAVKRYFKPSVRLWSAVVGVSIVGYLIATMLFMFWFNNPPQVANPYTRPGFSTLTVRQCTWEGTTKLLKADPIWGSGLAGFSSDYLNHATCDAEPLVYPHNLVLNFWSETGLFGLVSIFGLLIIWLILSGRQYFNSEELSYIGLGLTLVPCYWLIHGLVDVPYFKNDLSMLWWVMFGLTLVITIKLNAIEDFK